jgi:TolB protein
MRTVRRLWVAIMFAGQTLNTTLAAEPDCPKPNGAAEAVPRLTVATNRFGGRDLITLDVFGQGLVRLTKDQAEADEPSWSPDGKRLMFRTHVGGESRLQWLDAVSLEVKPFSVPLQRDRNAVWSPDGKRLAFTSDRGGNADVFVMEQDETHVLNLTNHPAFDADPAWSPDGRKLAFASNRAGHFRLYVMQSDGSNVVDLLKLDLPGTVFPTWSSDGQQLVFGGPGAAGTTQLHVVNADGQGDVQLTEGGSTNSFAAWSPDGQYLAYAHFERPSYENGAIGDLMIYNVIEGTHTRLLTAELPGAGSRPCWVPMRTDEK